jgi:hypothetical protein
MSPATIPVMVRRDATERQTPKGESLEVARCAFPAGASPVPVSAGAPGSRPQASLERVATQAGCQKSARRREPRSGEQARGPQHERPPVSRVREIRMHGLKGGLAPEPALKQEGK